MSFVEHDQSIQAVLVYAADQSLAIRILPGRTWCNQNFLDIHILDSILEVIAVDAIAISDKKTWCFLVGESIDDLLGGPFGAGIRGQIEMDDLPTVMTKNDKYVQDAKRHCGDCKEIAGGNIGNMIGQKCSPSLGWWFYLPNHVFGHGRFGDFVAQQKQFGQDSGCTPRWVFSGHALD